MNGKRFWKMVSMLQLFPQLEFYECPSISFTIIMYYIFGWQMLQADSPCRTKHSTLSLSINIRKFGGVFFCCYCCWCCCCCCCAYRPNGPLVLHFPQKCLKIYYLPYLPCKLQKCCLGFKA